MTKAKSHNIDLMLFVHHTLHDEFLSGGHIDLYLVIGRSKTNCFYAHVVRNEFLSARGQK